MSMAEDFSDKKEKINMLMDELIEKHGNPFESGQWKLWCKRPKTIRDRETVIIESILTQRTNWSNVEKSIRNLRSKKLLSLSKILKCPTEVLEKEIKSSGFARQKALRIKNIAKFFIYEMKGLKSAMKMEKDYLRNKLLGIHGIGEETADDILLYALDKPVFVIDQYTKRFVRQHNIAEKTSYNYLQKLFEFSVKKDYKIYQDYHALIIIEMKGKNAKKGNSNIYA